MHPLVLGEFACGNLKNREKVLGYLAALPSAVAATEPEAVWVLDRHRLWGRGIVG